MPPSPEWVCPAGYATPPVAGCAYTQDDVHARPPVSAGIYMQTAEPADWNTKHNQSHLRLSTLMSARSNEDIKARTEGNEDEKDVNMW